MSEWIDFKRLESQKYICGFCGVLVGSDIGYIQTDEYHNYEASVYICSNCDKPTYFDEEGKSYPSPHFGNPVKGLTPDIENLYNEARACTSVKAYTASVLLCRKLLMNIAVQKEAPEGLNFMAYVDYLDKEGFIARDCKIWVDQIRQVGNEATHEIKLMTKEDAEDLITFSEMLLKTLFEYPEKLKVPF